MKHQNHDQYALKFYLDWVNNYLTVAKIAEHNEISEEKALALIDKGRKLHNLRANPKT